ncbi:hypothetical protein [Clostridium sp. AF32-12BH]|uniref:hypothetical protein n=1 Tax=Clostridium sp. AF32-12BH TaxID=2292006 RepID=UPI000E52E642|nr:hypothetical protein [Clostridium sp. AF32-12BH]RHP47050.1 hypothetical protein DWZ40_09110 [Clostridium sp. AF32-12BH]
MPTKRTAGTTTPANKQKGKKICTCCKTEKKLVDGFYISKSPLFSVDERLPVCKDCIADMCVDKETGEINEVELNKTLRKFDKPYYKNDLMSAYEQFEREHAYIDKEDIKSYGRDIIKLYFKNISMRQCINKSYEDSEKDGFIHRNTNASKSKTQQINAAFADVNRPSSVAPDDDSVTVSGSIKWTKKDKQNMKYVISIVGYDPFEDLNLSEQDRKYCFNILSGYCDAEGISEDGHKIQCVIQLSNLYCQCRKIDETINLELSKDNVDESKVAKLTSSKSSILSSIATIAKDNNIASNYNKNSTQGKNTLSAKMKEIVADGFEEMKVNLFDINTSASMKQIADLSNQSIMDQLTFDSNEYTEMIKEQREMIVRFQNENERLEEENRILKNKVEDLESKKR